MPAQSRADDNSLDLLCMCTQAVTDSLLRFPRKHQSRFGKEWGDTPVGFWPTGTVYRSLGSGFPAARRDSMVSRNNDGTMPVLSMVSGTAI